MTDGVRTFARRSGLGEAERLVPLKGAITTSDSKYENAHLYQTAEGVWLVAADALGDGAGFDLSEAADFTYERRHRGDRIQVNHQWLDVSVRDGERAQEALGVGRLRRVGGLGSGATMVQGRYVDAYSPVEREWLRANTSAQEFILAWLDASRAEPVESRISPGMEASWHWLITDRRACLVALSGLGESEVVELPPGEVTVEPGRLRDTLRAGAVEWECGGLGRDRIREIAAVVPLVPRTRREEVARLLWVNRGKDAAEVAAVAAKLLLSSDGDSGTPPLARAVSRILPIAAEEPEDDPIERPALEAIAGAARDLLVLSGDPDAATAAAEWYLSWRFPRQLGSALMQNLIEQAEEQEELQWCVAIHSAVRDAVAPALDARELAVWDARLAEHLLNAGRAVEAAPVIRRALASLPGTELIELLTPEGADLVKSETSAVGAIRVQLLELLNETLTAVGTSPLEATLELARLQPLSPGRLEDLIDVADGELLSRAEAARRVLEPGGLERVASSASRRFTRVATGDLERLVHPEARSGGRLAGFLKLVAEQDLPTAHLHMMDRATEANAPGLRDALSDSSLVLEVPAMTPYLASGDGAVGARAIPEPTPIVIVGREHVQPDSMFFLDQAELRSAIGSELANVRFGNARLTSSEVWAGAAHKSQLLAEVALSVVPLFGSSAWPKLAASFNYSTIRKVVPLNFLKAVYKTSDGRTVRGKVGQDVRDPAGAMQSIGRAVGIARDTKVVKGLRRGLAPVATAAEGVAAKHIDALAAMRSIQLTSDRAGLLLGGDLASSIRSMFLTSPPYGPELALAVRSGLPDALERRGRDGHLILEDLAVRVAALISFYLSDDYRILVAAEPQVSADSGVPRRS